MIVVCVAAGIGQAAEEAAASGQPSDTQPVPEVELRLSLYCKQS